MVKVSKHKGRKTHGKARVSFAPREWGYLKTFAENVRPKLHHELFKNLEDTTLTEEQIKVEKKEDLH